MFIWKYKIATNKINKILFEKNEKKLFKLLFIEIFNFSLPNHYNNNNNNDDDDCDFLKVYKFLILWFPHLKIHLAQKLRKLNWTQFL